MIKLEETLTGFLLKKGFHPSLQGRIGNMGFVNEFVEFIAD